MRRCCTYAIGVTLVAFVNLRLNVRSARRAFDHFLDRVSNGEMRTQPLLRALDITVAVIGFSLEDNVRSESVLMKLEREATCDFLCGRAGVACDEVKSHVVPGRQCA